MCRRQSNGLLRGRECSNTPYHQQVNHKDCKITKSYIIINTTMPTSFAINTNNTYGTTDGLSLSLIYTRQSSRTKLRVEHHKVGTKDTQQKQKREERETKQSTWILLPLRKSETRTQARNLASGLR